MVQDTTNSNNMPQGNITINIPAQASLDSTQTKASTDHIELLKKLLEQLKKLDFKKLAFPQVEKLRDEIAELQGKLTNPDGSMNTDPSLGFVRKEWEEKIKELEKLKVTEKHFLILGVENILKVAMQKEWGLCKNLDFIYLYNSAFWSIIDKEEFQKFLGEGSEKMGIGKYIARFYLFREKLFKQFIATAYLSAPNPPKNSVLVNLRNGTFEVTPEGTKLREFRRDDFLTYQLPFDYNPVAKAPLFDKYLEEVLPDEQSRKVLAEYIGYVFVRPSTLKLEKALLLYGSGANGKSVFFEIINALLGAANVSSFTLQSLTDESGYYRAKIANKLVNYASEINGKLETSIFKLLVSGEPVGARLPYGQPFSITDYAKLIFNANKLPTDVEHTNAYFRRFLIIPFDQTIPEEKQDKELSKKIIDSELSGVFNWVLEGLGRILENKRFSECNAAVNARKQYESESNSVLRFINQEDSEWTYRKHATDYTPIKELFMTYREFCIDEGLKAVKKSNFINRLKGAKIVVDRRSFGMIAFITKVKNEKIKLF